MLVRDTARTNNISSGVRTLEEIKSEMSYWENEQKNISDQLFKERGGFRYFTADKEKVNHLEDGMKNARENYKRVEKEYENHPNYYEDKYQNTNATDKAVKGIVNSAVASIPVIAETISAAKKETTAKAKSEEYAAALQAEKIAWNKMNDYAASYFGSFDLINQSELDRLNQEYEQASQHRKEIEQQYEEPVDMNSKGMKLMDEAAWLKSSATEGLNGIWKAAANTAIDFGQDVALAPLLFLGQGRT